MSTPRNVACTSNVPTSPPGAMSKTTFLKLRGPGFRTGPSAPSRDMAPPLPPTLLARQRRASPAVSLPLTAHLPSAARSRPSPQEASPASSALGCLEPWQTRPAAETSAAGVPAPSPRQLPQGGAHASPLPWGGPEPRPQRSPGAAASPLPPQPPPCEDRGTRTERRAGLRSPAAPPCPGAGRPCSGGPAASSLSRSS